jgi:hypothetical protein
MTKTSGVTPGKRFWVEGAWTHLSFSTCLICLRKEVHSANSKLSHKYVSLWHCLSSSWYLKPRSTTLAETCSKSLTSIWTSLKSQCFLTTKLNPLETRSMGFSLRSLKRISHPFNSWATLYSKSSTRIVNLFWSKALRSRSAVISKTITKSMGIHSW